MKQQMFHLAFPAHDLKATEVFYVQGLGCLLGRKNQYSIIMELGGNQIVAQYVEKAGSEEPQKGIYPRHFGLVLKTREEWESYWRRAEKNKLKVYRKPRPRFLGEPIEHRTFFLEDPSGNLLEFKWYKNESAIFGEIDSRKAGERG